MPDLDDLDPSEISGHVARVTTAVPFDALITRARRRTRFITSTIVSAIVLVCGGAVGVAAFAGSTDSSAQDRGSASQAPACSTARCLHLPNGAEHVTRAQGDFDADGRPDTFLVYAVSPHTGSEMRWVAQVDLATGSIVRATLPASDDPSGEIVLGAVDVNGDGRAEAFVRVHEGASDDFLRIYGLIGSRLVPAHTVEGQTWEYGVGGSVEFGTGLHCRVMDGRPLLVTTGFDFPGLPNIARWTRAEYRWDGLALTEASAQHGVVPRAGTGKYATFDCFGVSNHSGPAR